MDEADKKQISTLLQSGRSNSEIAYWLSRAYSGEIETLIWRLAILPITVPRHRA